MAKQEREVTDPNEAFELLGIKNQVTDPDGNPVTTEEPQQVEPQPEPESPAPQPTDTSEQQTFEFAEEEEQPAADDVPPEEKQRRSWQAEADKAKADKERIEREYQQRLELMQEQNRQLMNVVTPFMQKYGDTSQQQAQPVQSGPPEEDFIVDGYFDQGKYRQWQDKRDQWLKEEMKKEILGSLDQRDQEKTLRQQLAEVRQEFPEYVNPLTGEVDIQRLQNDLESYTSQKTLAQLLREAKGKAAPQQKTQTSVLDSTMNAIERNANKPQSAAMSPEAGKERKPVSKKLQQTAKIFGGNFELPPDFDGLED